MNKTFVKSIMLVALCTLALSGEAFAKGGSGGGSGGGVSSGSALRTHTMTQTKIQTQTKTQVKSQQQLRDGSAVADSSAQGGSPSEKGHFGVADGTDTPLQPLDGTGLGSPTNR